MENANVAYEIPYITYKIFYNIPDTIYKISDIIDYIYIRQNRYLIYHT